LTRLTTGVAGLDVVLRGGLEPGAVVLLAGAPGTGKTILAQHICFTNATTEHKCVYYTTMSEPHGKLVRHLEPFAFFDPEAVGARVEFIHLGGFLPPALPDGLEPLVSEIVRKALDEEPAIVVIDSAKMLREFAGERELRHALFDLIGRLSQTGAVLLLLGEYTPDELLSGIEFSLADGIIQLDYQAHEPIDRRWLRVAKMRGGSQLPGRHTLEIGPGGIEVFPRTETVDLGDVTPVSGRIRSGIQGLDELMGGGMLAGDASLVLGPSGVGKSNFGMCWAAEALRQGDRGLYVTFQDTEAQLMAMADGLGCDIGAARAAGQFVILHYETGELDLDVLAATVRAELARKPVARLVFDSLAELAYANHEVERFASYKRSLLGLVRAAGTSLLATSETTGHSFVGKTLDGLMYLFDNVVSLRYIERGSQLGRALNVVKMRNSRHDMALNSFEITDHGLAIAGKIEGASGNLGWSALRAQEPLYPAGQAIQGPR
jgi:circadian clock protein KaiC